MGLPHPAEGEPRRGPPDRGQSPKIGRFTGNRGRQPGRTWGFRISPKLGRRAQVNEVKGLSAGGCTLFGNLFPEQPQSLTKG